MRTGGEPRSSATAKPARQWRGRHTAESNRILGPVQGTFPSDKGAAPPENSPPTRRVQWQVPARSQSSPPAAAAKPAWDSKSPALEPPQIARRILRRKGFSHLYGDGLRPA